MIFTGKNVLITGGSRGIGAEISRVLAQYGLKVWINYRSSSAEADSLKAEIDSNGGTSAVIQFDVTDEQAFTDAIKLITETDGQLSYLVNNAGITNDKLAIRMKTDDFMSVINANLTSAFVGCRESLKVMQKKRFGAVVNIASIVGETGNAGQVNYSASKGGMITMTKSFAQEGSARGIRFNTITPGFIETDMTSKLKDEIKQDYINKIPLKRFGQPSEIAQTVAFLLSDGAGFITGETIKVNGGMLM
jgi:3-oxoacyl-[acyl-carrier protein] reductase